MAKRNSSSTTLWLVTGVLIIAVAAGLYYLKNQGKVAVKQQPSAVAGKQAQQQPLSNPLKQKPQFDFYNVLPQSDNSKSSTAPVAPPAKQPKVIDNSHSIKNITATKPSNPPAATAQPTNVKFYLQVASLKNYADADALKADLTLQGYAVSVAKVNIGNDVRYRVNIGPYPTLERAQTDQKILRSNNRPSIIVKGK